MPDEQNPVPEKDTPEATEGGPATDGTPADSPEESQAPDTNWQQRYTDLQPEYTRATQEAAGLRELVSLAQQGDPEALAVLGFEVGDDAGDYDEGDDDEYDPDARLDAVESYLSQQAEQQQQAQQEQEWNDAVEEHLAGQLEELEKEHGTLADDDAEFLLQLADSLKNEDGFPDLKAAFEADRNRLEGKRGEWVKTKRTPQVQSGASPSHQPDLDDPEERREYMARRVAEAEEAV